MRAGAQAGTGHEGRPTHAMHETRPNHFSSAWRNLCSAYTSLNRAPSTLPKLDEYTDFFNHVARAEAVSLLRTSEMPLKVNINNLT